MATKKERELYGDLLYQHKPSNANTGIKGRGNKAQTTPSNAKNNAQILTQA